MIDTQPVYINGFPFSNYRVGNSNNRSSEVRSQAFYQQIKTRRSVRQFSDKAVSKTIIENILRTANSAPSGANLKPWSFCAVQDQAMKIQIREAAEKEEFDNYNGRMPEEWKKHLGPLQTDWHKEFLEIAPWLIVVFKHSFELESTGEKFNNYYAMESVGIATGFLISAIHIAGLATLTHTPSPMNFLSKLLNRPANEKAFLLLPVGFPAENCLVPDLQFKNMEETSFFF